MNNLAITITYSKHERRWIVSSNGTKRSSTCLSYECKNREAALTLAADLFEMNI